MGLSVSVSGDLPAHHTVEIESTDRSEIFECFESDPCDPVIFLPDFLPSIVSVEIEGRGFHYREEFVPEYDVTFPNGRECNECLHGTVTVHIE